MIQLGNRTHVWFYTTIQFISSYDKRRGLAFDFTSSYFQSLFYIQPFYVHSYEIAYFNVYIFVPNLISSVNYLFSLFLPWKKKIQLHKKDIGYVRDRLIRFPRIRINIQFIVVFNSFCEWDQISFMDNLSNSFAYLK